MAFAFKYSDRDGAVTERTVEVNRFSAEHIIGYCYLRRCRRTFRIDRIVNDEVIDTTTGEVINAATGEVK
ncbi:hypothetical protein CPT_Ptah_019 [Stenotrophomonas phage Ptah]|uniref:WYL domain-containing protein n=1 Tax=Stenotrophomonas phage Ptah TaxID=2859657 RepID=A0AAE8BHP7_9CAUD|nr:hypothetical protein CPT_Ptah_019 [Stenotrophomonas phage Ptah]